MFPLNLPLNSHLYKPTTNNLFLLCEFPIAAISYQNLGLEVTCLCSAGSGSRLPPKTATCLSLWSSSSFASAPSSYPPGLPAHENPMVTLDPREMQDELSVSRHISAKGLWPGEALRMNADTMEVTQGTTPSSNRKQRVEEPLCERTSSHG